MMSKKPKPEVKGKKLSPKDFSTGGFFSQEELKELGVPKSKRKLPPVGKSKTKKP
jgi:hypothetical protein